MQFNWLRLFLRRRTRPIHLQTATDWKKRLSVGYMLLCWNAFGFVCYMMYTGRTDWVKYYGYRTEEEPSPGLSWARSLDKSQAKVIRMSGFHIKSEETYIKEAETQEDVSTAP